MSLRPNTLYTEYLNRNFCGLVDTEHNQINQPSAVDSNIHSKMKKLNIAILGYTYTFIGGGCCLNIADADDAAELEQPVPAAG